MKIDLHCHTSCSDGHLSVTELIDRAVSFDVKLLAITDHDSIDAFATASSYIEANQLDLTFISGIEISTLWENKDIHVVGLNVDVHHSALVELIAEQRQKRIERAQLIAHRLAKHLFREQVASHGSDLTQIEHNPIWQDICAMVGDGAISRSHFGQWLVEKGYVSSMNQAFKKYLTRTNPGYVPPNWCSIEHAIEVIHAAGGQAVLAHPARYKLTTKWLKRLLEAFANAGGDGMEVAQPRQTPQERRLLADYAIHYQLLASQGSDFHYPSPWTELGRNLWLPSGVEPIWKDWSFIADLPNSDPLITVENEPPTTDQ